MNSTKLYDNITAQLIEIGNWLKWSPPKIDELTLKARNMGYENFYEMITKNIPKKIKRIDMKDIYPILCNDTEILPGDHFRLMNCLYQKVNRNLTIHKPIFKRIFYASKFVSFFQFMYLEMAMTHLKKLYEKGYPKHFIDALIDLAFEEINRTRKHNEQETEDFLSQFKSEVIKQSETYPEMRSILLKFYPSNRLLKALI